MIFSFWFLSSSSETRVRESCMNIFVFEWFSNHKVSDDQGLFRDEGWIFWRWTWRWKLCFNCQQLTNTYYNVATVEWTSRYMLKMFFFFSATYSIMDPESDEEKSFCESQTGQFCFQPMLHTNDASIDPGKCQTKVNYQKILIVTSLIIYPSLQRKTNLWK